MTADIPGINELVGPGLQPGVATPEAPDAQVALCDVGVAASSMSGTAMQPPRAASNGSMTATAHRKRGDRSGAGMQWRPFGIGAGPALMLPDMESACDAVPSLVFCKG